MGDPAGGGTAVSAVECARVVVQTLLEKGAGCFVLCPGSRSAPFALELARRAREDGLELHVRIDERDAGFLALGLAKASGRVVPVVTTSGTAVGNLLPAVMEASHSHVPLLVISADRPESMLHTGANQTTDQVRIFGNYVIADARISSTDGDGQDWAAQVSRLAMVGAGELGGTPGPTHLNVALREPLVGEPEPVTRENRTHPTLVHRGPRQQDFYRIHGNLHTVVLVGDAPPEVGAWANEMAQWYDLPLFAEPSSSARSGTALRSYRLLLDSELGQQINRVVVVGHPTLSRPVTRLLARKGIQRIGIPSRGAWSQPGGRGLSLIDASLDFTGSESIRREFADRWQVADERVSGRMDELLGDRLTGQTAAAAVVESLGAEEVLVAGSSNPIRDLDLAPVPEQPFLVYANRGLAGIDGTVSTAAGIALATDKPVTALLGDLTFLHDIGGLLIGPLERRPRLRLVVVNDDGGSIFHSLEQGDEAYATSFERVFGTPTGVRLQPVVEGYGWRYTRAESLVGLKKLLAEPVVEQEVIEVPVGRQDRRALDQQLRNLGVDV